MTLRRASAVTALVCAIIGAAVAIGVLPWATQTGMAQELNGVRGELILLRKDLARIEEKLDTLILTRWKITAPLGR